MVHSRSGGRVLKLRPPKHRFPDVWYEGLAYHEAGRTIATAALLDVPIKRISLGYLSTDPTMNSLFELDFGGPRTMSASPIRAATIFLAPQFAARQAPHYQELRRLHRRERYLPPFEASYREPMRDARKAFAHIYEQAGLADSTARVWFKRDALRPIEAFAEANRAIIRGVAEFLYAQKEATGSEIGEVLGRFDPILTTPLRLR